jgi:hypothetical protein
MGRASFRTRPLNVAFTRVAEVRDEEVVVNLLLMEEGEGVLAVKREAVGSVEVLVDVVLSRLSSRVAAPPRMVWAITVSVPLLMLG